MREITKKKKPRTCIKCGKRKWKVSKKGICQSCLAAIIRNANDQIKLKEGPAWEKWRASMFKFLERK